MTLPFFYISSGNVPAALSAGPTAITLDEDNSRHIVQVLRMKPGEKLQLTDGRGNLYLAAVTDDHKKRCSVAIESRTSLPFAKKPVTLAVSLLKNASRFEWLLEKATEIGVTEIIPLLCERTEKQHFRQDRMQNILVSAMLQSQQTWLPVLQPPLTFPQVLEIINHDQLFIAHCLEEQRTPLTRALKNTDTAFLSQNANAASTSQDVNAASAIILIGPEGDFTKKEIDLSLEHGFLPVTLGHTRLRTETAAIVAATLLCVE